MEENSRDEREKTDHRERVEEEELSEAFNEEEEEEEEEFEFAFSIDSEPGLLPDTAADEMFYNGRIRSIYPVFNRRLVIGAATEDSKEQLDSSKLGMRSGSESSFSSMMSEATTDMERLSQSAPTTNFASPDRWRKSSSTGSSASAAASRKWKLRDLVVGRSRSDGKERFLVVPPPPIEKAKSKEKEKKETKSSGKGKGEKSKEMDIVTAHRIYYGKVGSGGGQLTSSGGTTRRSFLPYRQELLGGIFGNAKHHPF